MTTYPLFKFAGIDETDWTPCIKMGTYKVNRQPSYTEWEDGNGGRHRHEYARKIKGTFTMIFNGCAYDSDGNICNGQEQYEKFLQSLLESRNSDGCIPVYIYIVNENVFEPADVYISTDITNEIPYINGVGDAQGFEVTIEEK